jgi:hypothetical protein
VSGLIGIVTDGMMKAIRKRKSQEQQPLGQHRRRHASQNHFATLVTPWAVLNTPNYAHGWSGAHRSSWSKDQF